jgi:hypothetical protein
MVMARGVGGRCGLLAKKVIFYKKVAVCLKIVHIPLI